MTVENIIYKNHYVKGYPQVLRCMSEYLSK